MSVMSSRLRHHGVPGLQAQKWVSTENTRANTIVIGTTLAIVWPNISTTSRGKFGMATSSDQVSQGYPFVLKEPSIKSRRRPRARYDRRHRNQYCIVGR